MTERITNLSRLALLVTIGTLAACQSETSTVMPSGGGEKAPYMNRCGRGENRIDIGVGEPYQKTPSVLGSDGNTSYQFSVYEGHQGGYHVDISLRIEGSIDPDLVDVAMSLTREAKVQVIATHRVDEWYLKLTEKRQHCEYPLARLVFAQSSGQLMSLEEVLELLEHPLKLEIQLSASDAVVSENFDIILTEVIRLE